MTHTEYCDAIAAEIERLSAAIAGADLETPVATCPPWDLAQLIKHLGLVHRWAMRMLREVAQQRLDSKLVELNLPADESGYPAWFTAGGEELVATLRAADPNAGMAAWGADHHARFWMRRMVHETGMHRADAEIALGRQPSFQPAIAADGIDEFLENLPYAAWVPSVKELRGNGESIHLHCTDTEGEWLIELTPDGFSWHHAHGKGSAAVRGTASDLLLLMYGRKEAADGSFEVFGDSALLDRWFAKAHI